jgi:hypothetical protein
MSLMLVFFFPSVFVIRSSNYVRVNFIDLKVIARNILIEESYLRYLYMTLFSLGKYDQILILTDEVIYGLTLYRMRVEEEREEEGEDNRIRFYLFN